MKIIKIILNGHIKSLTENMVNKIDTKGIKKDNIISYISNNVSHKLIIDKDKITLIRENNEFKSIMEFIYNKPSNSIYLLKENNIEINIKLKTTSIKNTENQISIIYEILDSKEKYEYKIEMR